MGHVLLGCVYSKIEETQKQTEDISVFHCLQYLREKNRHVPLLPGERVEE